IQNAFAYNQYHVKHVGRLRDASFSGWKPALMFPGVDQLSASSVDRGLMMFAVGVVAGFACLGRFGGEGRSGGVSPRDDRGPLAHLRAIVVLGLVTAGVGALAAAATGRTTLSDYVPGADRARAEAEAYSKSHASWIYNGGP